MFLKVFVLLGIVFGLQIINTEAKISRFAQQSRSNVSIAEDHRCFALSRRTVVVRAKVTYVCSRPYPGVVTIGYFNSSIGQICKGRMHIPSTRYFRTQMCCPGWSPDQYGRCTVSNKTQVPEITAKNEVPKDNKGIRIPFKQVSILMKRMQEFARQNQNMMHMRLAKMNNQMVPPPPAMLRNIQRMKIAAIRQRMQNMAQQQMKVTPPEQMPNIPKQSLQAASKAPNVPTNHSHVASPVKMSIPQPMLHTRIVSTPITAHRRIMMMQRPPLMPSIIHARLMHMITTIMQRLSLPGSRVSENERKESGPAGIPVAELPRLSFKDIRVTIQPRSNARFSRPQCFVNYVAKMKSCFANADLPTPPAVGPIGQPNDSNFLNAVCSKRKMIAVCLFSDLSPCQSSQENVVARRILRNVARSLERMCLNEPGAFKNIAVVSVTEPDDVLLSTTVRTLLDNITHVTDNETGGDNGKNSLHHSAKIDEIGVLDYYWPILIGTAAGFIVLIILLTATVCVCCRRRYMRKFSLKKQEKTHKLFDGIFSIGLPPPLYEVTTIPPLFYEEIRGVKLTNKMHEPDTEPKSTNVGQISNI